MQNGGNGGEGSGQIVPQVVQPDQVEEVRTLVPQAALEAIPGQPTPPRQPFELFDSSRIFVHAPQYHWHAIAAEGAAVLEQEAREHIVSIADLLDHFGHQTELREEELWAHFESSTEGSQVVRLVEPMDVRLTGLEKQVYEVETSTLTSQLKIESKRQYLDQQLYQVHGTLIKFTRRMNIVEEITKNWNRMLQELTTITTKIVMVRESQIALPTLMEGISTRLDTIAET